MILLAALLVLALYAALTSDWYGVGWLVALVVGSLVAERAVWLWKKVMR